MTQSPERSGRVPSFEGFFVTDAHSRVFPVYQYCFFIFSFFFVFCCFFFFCQENQLEASPPIKCSSAQLAPGSSPKPLLFFFTMRGLPRLIFTSQSALEPSFPVFSTDDPPLSPSIPVEKGLRNERPGRASPPARIFPSLPRLEPEFFRRSVGQQAVSRSSALVRGLARSL